MQKKAGYKIKLFLAYAITAAVLCALPFLVYGKTVINVYPSRAVPNAAEKALITALQQQGYKVKISPSSSKKDIALWFRPPEQVGEAAGGTAKYNFMYSDAHYPFAWQEHTKLPIILTPHQDLYEHYMRSNVKAAVFPKITINSAPGAAIRLKEIIDWLNKIQAD